MTIPTLDPVMTAAQEALDAHASTFDPDLRAWLEANPGRASEWTRTAADLCVDLSKDLIGEGMLADLSALAQQYGVGESRDRMFAGEHINTTEDHMVLHTTLRHPDTDGLVVDGQDVIVDVHGALAKVCDFAGHVYSGEWVGIIGKVVRTIVNVDIGDSDLGPVMAYEAFKPLVREGLECRFISNIDPTDAGEAAKSLDLETVLMIVAPRISTALETVTNAKVVRDWSLSSLRERGLAQDKAGEKEAVARHFAAASTTLDKAAEFGIDPSDAFGFWSWVGGRYLMNLAVGTSLAIVTSPDGPEEFLMGFSATDEHFSYAVSEQNVPLLVGPPNVWHSNFLDAGTHVVLPYFQYLHCFPVYFQQLAMGSDGKPVCRDSIPVTYETCEVFQDEPDTNGQHTFYQPTHQDTRMVPAGFIASANPTWPLKDGEADMHKLFLSNFFMRTKTLTFGKTSEEVRTEGTPEAIISTRVSTGNRPTTSIMVASLTSRVFGELITPYEHITFVQDAVQGVDSFDQWGIELGKVLVKQIFPAITGDTDALATQDSSTCGFIEFYHANRV